MCTCGDEDLKISITAGKCPEHNYNGHGNDLNCSVSTSEHVHVKKEGASHYIASDQCSEI